MPVAYLDLPSGLEVDTKEKLVKEVAESIHHAYLIPDTRVFLREWPPEQMSVDGLLGRPMRPICDFVVPRGLPVEAKPLLRSINLGSHKKVAMDDLREVFTELGFSDVRSLLQTGNVIFRSQSQTTANLERLLETEVDQRLALQTAFFVRTGDEWKSVGSHNPFREEARRDPAHLVVVFLKDAPDANQGEGTSCRDHRTRARRRSWQAGLHRVSGRHRPLARDEQPDRT